MEDLHEREAARLAEIISLLVRVSGRSRRSLEQEMELGQGGLGKLLGGKGGLQISHVLKILAALGVDPGDFFRWVYPFRGRSSELIENARALGGPTPDSVSPPSPSPDAAFDERVREALLRLLRPGG
jgi:hypothetical protein